MAAFSRGKAGRKSIYVPMREGFIQRSTGTADGRIVRAMGAMVKALADESRYSGDWTVQEALRAKRITLADLYAAHVRNEIPQLRARLSAKNLAAYLPGWRAWLRATRRAEVRTDANYWAQVTTLVPPDGEFLTADLDKARVMAWLASRAGVTSGTRRKYLYALKSFVTYLMELGVYQTDPLAGLKAPKKNPPRERWETEATDRRIVDAAKPKYRALFAFIKATGADVSTAFRTLRRDLDLDRGRVLLRGTKTGQRVVHEAEIEPWALPILREYASEFLPNAPLWPAGQGAYSGSTGRAMTAGYSRSGAHHHHLECCKAVGVEDYTLKDARHSVAVRMRKRGRTFEEIAGQLGNSVYQTATVYARFQPDTTTDSTTGLESHRVGHEVANA